MVFVLLIVINVITIALGYKILKLLNVNNLSQPIFALFSFGIGFGLISYLFLFIGLIGLLYKWIVFVLLIILLLFCFNECRYLITRFLLWVINFPKLKLSRLEVFLLMIILLLVGMNLINSLAPITSGDALTYHLAVPKRFIQNHKIYYMTDIWSSNLPSLVSMVFMFGMLIYSETLAALIPWLLSVFVIMGIFYFSKIKLPRNYSLLAVILFYSMWVTTSQIPACMVDMGWTLYTLLAVWALVYWMKKDKLPFLILSAIFCGFAAATKIYAILTPAILGLSIIIHNLDDIRSRKLLFKSMLWQIFLFGGIAFLVILPWYLKTGIWTGNPIYPLFQNIFNGNNSGSELWKTFADFAQKEGAPYGRTVWGLIFSPWKLTFYSTPSNDLGFLWLALLPSWVMIRKKHKTLTSLLFYCTLIYISWYFFFLQRGRHLISIMPILSIVTAHIIKHIYINGSNYLRRIMVMVVVISIGIGLFGNFRYSIQYWPVVFGFESEEDYLNRQLQHYADIHWINNNLGLDSRVFHDLPPNSNFLFDVDYLWGGYGNAIPFFESENSAMKMFRDQGITHFLHKSGMEYEYTQAWPDLVDKYLQPIYRDQRIVPVTRSVIRNMTTIETVIYKINYDNYFEFRTK